MKTSTGWLGMAVIWAVLATPAAAQLGGTDPLEVPNPASPVGPSLTPDVPMVPSTSSRGAIEDPLIRNASPPLSGPVDPATYLVGPGDLLQLQLWGRLSRNWLVQVGPEGYVLIPGSGSVRVDGKTLSTVRAEILSKLQTQYRGVNMDVRLARPRIFRVYVTGQVKSPGPIEATASHRVADLLNQGVFLGDGSRRRIAVVHRDGTQEISDLELFFRTGRNELNPFLRDGDVLKVPVATDFVWAQGALARGGTFELGVNDSLITLFQLAGDPIPPADVDRALLIRWRDAVHSESLWVRLDEVYDRRTNPRLRDGDRLYVYYLPQYHLQHEAFIYGEVARPGAYPVSEGKHRLSDLIEAAGGFLSTADLSAIRVHRKNSPAAERDPEMERLLRLSRDQLTASEYDKLTTKLAGLREDYRVDWHRLSSNPSDLDLLLRTGDVVTVDRLVSSIRIDGQVRRPGILTFRDGQSVSDYVAQAGGFTDRAWRGRIRITRAVTGQTLPARNVRSLDPGDFVWVPEHPDRTVWDQTRDMLTALAQVATVIIAIRSID